MWFSPAFVVLDVAMVRVVRPVRYPPAVVRYQDEGVRQVACPRDRCTVHTASGQGAQRVGPLFCHNQSWRKTAQRSRGLRSYQRPPTLSPTNASLSTHSTKTDTANVVGASLTDHIVEGFIIAERAMAAVVPDYEERPEHGALSQPVSRPYERALDGQGGRTEASNDEHVSRKVCKRTHGVLLEALFGNSFADIRQREGRLGSIVEGRVLRYWRLESRRRGVGTGKGYHGNCSQGGRTTLMCVRNDRAYLQ